MCIGTHTKRSIWAFDTSIVLLNPNPLHTLALSHLLFNFIKIFNLFTCLYRTYLHVDILAPTRLPGLCLCRCRREFPHWNVCMCMCMCMSLSTVLRSCHSHWNVCMYVCIYMYVLQDSVCAIVVERAHTEMHVCVYVLYVLEECDCAVVVHWNVCMCMCVCLYMYVCVCMSWRTVSAPLSLHWNVYVVCVCSMFLSAVVIESAHTEIYVCMYVCMHVCVCPWSPLKCMYVRMYVRM